MFLRRVVSCTLPVLCSMPKRAKLKPPTAVASKRSKVTLVQESFVPPKAPSKAKMSKVKVLETPEKSENDKKEYRVIQLENGLKCLLISDTAYPLEKLDEEEEEEGSDDEGEEEESEDEHGDDSEGEDDEDEEEEGPSKPPASTGLKMSAAGLMVHMGSFSDPEAIPGLAHFLEHMVFMGSSKYPDENGFDSFIAKHGGYDNASTDTETTVFYFEAPRRTFQEGLDRFAQFFIAPLMKQDAMEREREAVDSEFQMALPSDSNRLCQVLGGLATPGHPMAKFMWGNKASLQPEGMTEEEMHRRLHEFRLRHYTAQAMYLAVQSQHTLDTLQDWVVASYSAVPNNGQEREQFADMLEPFNNPGWHRLYRIVPVKSEYKVDLSWALPPVLRHYRSKPLSYLSHLLGHEGRGSLMAFLRRKVWALDLTAGNAGDGFEYNETYSLFPITVTLTREGWQHLGEVVRAVFGYLDMLAAQPPSERLFKEIQRIEELGFTFGEERQPADNVEDLCESMAFYPPSLYLKGDTLLFDFDPAAISACLAGMTRDSVNVFLRSKEIPAESLDLVEPWFGTRYSSAAVPEAWLLPWPEAAQEFHLPEPNPFIAEDLALVPVEGEAGGKAPALVARDEQGELHYRQDTTFLQPRAYIHYLLRSPLQLRSPEDACLLDLLAMCLMQNIVEDVYPADLAQLRLSIHAEEIGLSIKVSGLSDKLPRLLEVVVARLATFATDTTEQLFQAVVEQQRKNYHNHAIKAKLLVRDVRLSLLQDVFHPAHARHGLVRRCTLEQLRAFAGRLVGGVYLQGLVQGNISRQAAARLDAGLRQALGVRPMQEGAVTELRCRRLPEGETAVVRVAGLDTTDANTLVTNYYQAGPGDLQLHATMEAIVMMMEEPVFDRLRTQEQLGYSVSITLRNTHGIMGMSVTVNTQATKFTPHHVDQRIEAFFEDFLETKLTEERVEEAVAALVKLKLRTDVTLEEEVARNWNEIHSKEFLFDRALREVEALSKVTVEGVRACLEPLLQTKLSVQVVGSSSPAAAQETVEEGAEEELELEYQGGEGLLARPEEWREGLHLYPVVYITQ